MAGGNLNFGFDSAGEGEGEGVGDGLREASVAGLWPAVWKLKSSVDELTDGPDDFTGGGGGGAFLLFVKEEVDETLAEGSGTNSCFFSNLRGIGGSKPTNGPPCCAM